MGDCFWFSEWRLDHLGIALKLRVYELSVLTGSRNGGKNCERLLTRTSLPAPTEPWTHCAVSLNYRGRVVRSL